MLTSIRTTFSKGFARWILIFLMSILIVSFGIWGIQDVFRGFGSTEVASVGGTKISIDTYQRAFNQELRQLSQRVGRPLTPTDARALGVDRQVLNRILNGAALDEQAHNYGLGLSSEKIAAIVLDDPNFKNSAGQFDAAMFGEILRQNGLTEAGFFSEQQKVYLRDQINEAIAGGFKAPKTMQEAFARYGGETRNISYITLTDAVLGDVGQPDPTALQSFFGERKGDFRAPEFRKFTYLSITPDDLAAKATVSDEDAKAQYDSRRDLYTSPEKRTVQQISFPNPTEAKAAADRITSGQATFDTIATERKVQGTDLELGTVTRTGLLDPVIAEAAFKLAEGGVSGAVDGKLSTVILRVTKIDPEVVTPFDQAKEQIKKDLALERAKKDLIDLEAKIEDERAGGATLKEIAGKFGFAATEIVAMDAQGRDAARQPYNLPLQDKLVPAIFSGEVGADTDPIDGREAGVVWYSVDQITPARDRTLEEAKGDVVAAWTSDEKAKRLEAKAQDLLKELNSGKAIADLAAANQFEIKEAWSLKRNQDAQGFSSAAVNLVFATPLKGLATALTGNGEERVVFQVTESLVPPFDPAAAASAQMNQQLSQLVEQDLLAQYVQRLQADLGVSINPTNVGRAVGGGGEG